ncbi:MAG: thioredoxin family protein [Chloroflexi bacterium]|nr:thioredoxin family protein [Chloroflexota bacterium]
MTARATHHVLTLGDHAPAFDLPATDGQTYSLQSFRDSPFLTVIFLANHCPYVSAWEDRIVAIAREFGARGTAFVGISSNDAAQVPQDGPEGMKRRVEEKGYPFPYLFDEDQAVAQAFGATRTPEVYVFDQDRLLVYHGAVDSDFEESSGMENYLRDALNALRSGQRILLPETPVVGCTIKRRS